MTNTWRENAVGLEGSSLLETSTVFTLEYIWSELEGSPFIAPDFLLLGFLISLVSVVLGMGVGSSLLQQHQTKDEDETEELLKAKLKTIRDRRNKTREAWMKETARLKVEEKHLVEKLEAKRVAQQPPEEKQREAQRRKLTELVKVARQACIWPVEKGEEPKSIKRKALYAAEQLCEAGKQLIKEEFNGKPWIYESILPIVIVLNEILIGAKKIVSANQRMQGEFLLLFNLTKAYRIFIELTWHQCWRLRHQGQVSWPIRQNVTNTIRDIANWYITNLPSDEALDMEFEWKCVKQAANCLPKEEAAITLLANVGQVISDSAKDPFGLISAGISFAWNAFEAALVTFPTREVCLVWKAIDMEHYKFDPSVASWYKDAHKLHWLATQITSINDFNECINSEILSKIDHSEGEYSICHAIFLMDIIDSSNDDNLRMYAFSNDNNQFALVQLFNQSDFRKTRLLIMQYLWKLAANRAGKYEKFQKSSLKLLKSQHEALQPTLSLVENKRLTWALQSLQEEANVSADTLGGQRYLAKLLLKT